MTYLTPTVYGVPLIVEVVLLAPVWEELLKVFCSFCFQTTRSGALFGYVEFLMYTIPTIFNPTQFAIRCAARYPALLMHMETDLDGSGVTSLARRIRRHFLFNLRATCMHILGTFASFMLIDAFGAGAMGAPRWQNATMRGTTRRGAQVDMQNPQPLNPPEPNSRDPSSDEDGSDESSSGRGSGVVRGLMREVQIRNLQTELRRVSEEDDNHKEDTAYRSRQRDRHVRQRNMEEAAALGHNTRVYRLYYESVDIIRLYTQEHKMIVPWACNEQAQVAAQLGYRSWENVTLSSAQVNWLQEKIRCMPESRNLLNAAEYWARTLDITDRQVARVAVQRHRIELARDAHAGVSMSGVTVGTLNVPAHPSSLQAGTFSGLLTLSITAVLCLLNGFAGWDIGQNTHAGQAKSMLNSAQTRLASIRRHTARFLGAVLGTQLW